MKMEIQKLYIEIVDQSEGAGVKFLDIAAHPNIFSEINTWF